MFGKWSNMAHAKNYFREKNSVFLRVFGLQSGEYSKIIRERMKGTTILDFSLSGRLKSLYRRSLRDAAV